MKTGVLRSCGSMAALAMAMAATPVLAQIDDPQAATTAQPGAIPDAGAQSDDIVATATSRLLHTSDAADDLLCVDLGGRRIAFGAPQRPPVPAPSRGGRGRI